MQHNRTGIKRYDKKTDDLQKKLFSMGYAINLKTMAVSKIDTKCRAKTKSTGQPCMNEGIYPSRRCKYHGGMSTGPRTKVGRKRSAQNGFKKGWSTKLKRGNLNYYSLPLTVVKYLLPSWVT